MTVLSLSPTARMSARAASSFWLAASPLDLAGTSSKRGACARAEDVAPDALVRPRTFSFLRGAALAIRNLGGVAGRDEALR